MKAQISEAALLGAARSVLDGVKSSDGRVTKHSTTSSSSSKNTKDTTEEMQVYFSKLKELVPFMPRNRKLSKLEIIQYVIDYICDLQLALEAHPTTTGARQTSPAGINNSNTSPVARQPLGVIANVPSNTSLSNTCAAQEAHHDKLPSHLDDLNTRPVSC